MTTLRQIQKTTCSQAMFLAIAAALVAIGAGAKPVGKGLILGALASVVNFVIMAQMLHFRLNTTRTRSQLASLGGIWLRFVLMGIPLFVALKVEQFNFFATAAGLFMVQVIILSQHIGSYFLEFRNKAGKKRRR